MDEIIKMRRHTMIRDIVVFGCGDSYSYGLPPSYGLEMGRCFEHLIAWGGEVRFDVHDLGIQHEV